MSQRRIIEKVRERIPVLALAVAIATLGWVGTACASGDEAILAAHEAWRAKDRARLDRIGRSTRDHVLSPYIDYWRVDLEPTDEAIQRFLAKHPGSALAERLRADWIRGLGRRGDWALIEAEAPHLLEPARDVRCWYWRARWARGDRVLPQGLQDEWRIARATPASCDSLFEALIDDGLIGADAIRRRARDLLAAGLEGSARRLLQSLPKKQAIAPRVLDAVLAQPERFVDRNHADARSDTDRELVAWALARVALADPMRAGRWYERVRIDAERRAWLAGQIGLALARVHDPDALRWFREAEPATLTDEHYEWWARGSLRAGAWAEVGRAIDRLTADARAAPRWHYWHARSRLALGAVEQGRAELARIAGEFDFYPRLAKEALGIAPRPVPLAALPTPAEEAQLDRHRGIRRAVALARLGRQEDAGREWRWAMRPLDDRALAAAAALALREELWSEAISASNRTRALHDLVSRYPMPLHDRFAAHSRSSGVERSLALAVARHESRFRAGAKSTAGAVGLMQLMPSTARAMAVQLDGVAPPPAAVGEPETNLRLGIAYLGQLRRDLGSSDVLAVTAYNSGPGRALTWRAERPLEGAVFVESIPIDETREYVQQVLASAMYYGQLHSGEARSLGEQMGTVPARSGPDRGAGPAGAQRGERNRR